MFCELSVDTRSNGGRDNGRLYTRNQEPARRPLPPVAQQYDPDQSWKQEQSAMRQSRPQELSNGQTREQFIAAMLARPSNPESGPGRPQPRTKQYQDASPARGRSQPMPSDVSILLYRQNIHAYLIDANACLRS